MKSPEICLTVDRERDRNKTFKKKERKTNEKVSNNRFF